MDDRPPLGKTRAHAAVLPETISQAVKPLGDGLIGRTREGFCAIVDLDAGKDAPGRKSLCERCAASTLLI